MPPKAKHDQEYLLQKAIELIKEDGLDGFTSRAIAARIGVSTTPLLSVFSSMEQLRSNVLSKLLLEQSRILDDHGLPAWIQLLASQVVYSWKEPKAGQALKIYLQKEARETSWKKLLALLRAEDDSKHLSDDQLAQVAFRAIVYTTGMADLAQQGYLYNPSKEGILADLKRTLKQLVFGGFE